ncbi:VOC family protein [Ilumatobacter sp.]|uniref:VOC family protein n=1 Tax=Ilumatobacter sp. TaxID=1967498 RepID=UPI003B52DFF9
MSWIRLRQVALVAHDLEAVVDELRRVLGLEVAHRDPSVAAFGLVNAVLPLGSQFVEVVSPTRPGTAGGRRLERLGGDGGYMVIGHTDDHDALRRRVDDLGVRVAMEHVDDGGYRILQLHPADTGGSFLELDFQPGGEDPDGPWMPAGDRWQDAVRTDVVSAITGVELRDPDPDGVAARWSAICDVPVVDGAIELDDATIRFTEGTGGLVAVDCRGSVERADVIAGVEFRTTPV